jgi:single-strand DNA-binding protein
MNKSIIVGRLGRDPEVRTTQGGMAVCNLAVATDDREKKNGEWVKVTDWHNVVCFGNDAEFAGKYLTKGASVAIEGKTKRRKYQAKDGTEKESVEIIADRVEAVGSRPSEHGASPRPAQPSAGADFSDEVPF